MVRARHELVSCVFPLLCASLVLVLSACTVDLQHDLNEDDANDIYVLLQKQRHRRARS